MEAVPARQSVWVLVSQVGQRDVSLQIGPAFIGMKVGRWMVAVLARRQPRHNAAMATGVVMVKPTGRTRPGDLRYNLMVRLGNLGCTHDVDSLATEALREHWRMHLAARR